MKKYFTIIAALFAIAAVSCQKEAALSRNNGAEENQTSESIAPTGDAVVFSANLPEAPDSRSILGAKDGSVYHPLWTATDSILVNGVASAEAQLSSGGLSARFEVACGDSSAFIALAPASQRRNDAYKYSEGSYDYLFPGAGRPQNYTVDGEGNPTYDPRVGLVAAYSNDRNLSFKHLNVYFRITATAGNDNDNIRYVYIRGGDGSMTAGTWTATYTDADHISIAPKSLTSVIALDCGDAGVSQGTPMIVAVPAYNFTEGLIVTIKDVNGHFVSFKINSSKTNFAAAPGTVYEFSREFSPESGTISTAADWEEFASAVNSNRDFMLYRWVGNGTVKIGADINTDNLTKIAPRKFPYNVDGQNHTITRSAATGALFRSVRGVVKNLNLAGTVTSVNTTCGSLADTLYNGGRITGCTNDADISVNTEDNQTGSRLGGFVGIMTGGTIDNCTNNGSVYSSVDCSSKTIYNLQIGGIVGQVDGSQTDSGDALLYNCINTGSVTADPVFKTTGHGYSITYAGAGGIAGWLRGTGHSFILNNCDNSGTVYYSAEQVTDPTGTKANSISVGGIVGIAGDQTGGNGYDSSIGTNGLNVTMRYCDNSGTIHNCGINYATTTTSNKRVYTGGIAGSLVGTSEKFAKLARCRNTGTLLTYDITGDDASVRPIYCQVAGGLIGYGGYVAIDSCKVNCTIGNGKRQSLALGGAIGHTMAPFTADRDTVWFTGYFVRVNGSNHINSSSFATVVKKWSTNNQNPLPAITGSSISNSRLGAVLYYYDTTAGDLADNSANCTNSTTLGAGIKSAAVRGQGYNTEELISPDVSFTGNITINSDPDL